MFSSQRLKFIGLTALMLAFITLTGCASPALTQNTSSVSLQPNSTFDPKTFDDSFSQVAYKPDLPEKFIQTGDTATITVNGFEEFSGIYTVGKDGTIFLGHIGKVYIEGKTLPEVQEIIFKEYSTCCLINPNVSVQIDEREFGKIVVDGAVSEAGVFEINEVITLTQAVALGGGINEDADPKSVMLSRVINGERKVSVLNLRDIQLAGALDPSVYPNDVIFVQDSKGRLLYNDFVKTIPLISAIIFGVTR